MKEIVYTKSMKKYKRMSFIRDYGGVIGFMGAFPPLGLIETGIPIVIAIAVLNFFVCIFLLGLALDFQDRKLFQSFPDYQIYLSMKESKKRTKKNMKWLI